MRKGQMTLEFLFIFAVGMVLLLYSVNSATFQRGQSSTTSLNLKICLDEKNLASTISDAITQVYSQGPGAKVTAFASLSYLSNLAFVERATGLSNPRIFITYGQLANMSYNGTIVGLYGSNGGLVFGGDNRNTFWERGMFQKNLTANSSVWNPSSSVDGYYGISIDPAAVPSHLKIVVEWNPVKPVEWVYNSTSGTLYINIREG